jgi:hypothetical protein
VFLDNSPGGFSHRFVIDGGPKYSKKGIEKRNCFEGTSSPDIEFIGDHLSRAFGIILFNLTEMMVRAIMYIRLPDTGTT